jgi:DNA topoisomerase VI subunit B
MKQAAKKGPKAGPAPDRTTFTTSREMEFFTRKELSMQIGHDQRSWPLALLKELVDNSLDACEAAGVAPRITVLLEDDSFSVRDNGPGLPQGTLRKSLDYAVRVSDKSYYVSPTRGQLGNALKCVWAAPFVADGKKGAVEVAANGRLHRIDVTLDQIARKPDLRVTDRPCEVKTGTLVKVFWPQLACYHGPLDDADFYRAARRLVEDFSLFNPHASFRVEDRGEKGEAVTLPRLHAGWPKWSPGEPTSPWWYDAGQLADLIRAEVAEGRGGGPRKTVRQLIAGFAGLSGKLKQKKVFEDADPPGEALEDLVRDSDVDHQAVHRLLDAMQAASRAIQPGKLGTLRQALGRRLQGRCGGSIALKQAAGYVGTVPFVLEVAFGIDAGAQEAGAPQDVICGVNWSPALRGTIPFPELGRALGENRIDWDDPVVLAVHLACPLMRPTDRGKSRYDLPPGIGAELERLVRLAAKDWKKAKLRSDRVSRQECERLRKAGKPDKVQLKEAAYRVMEQAYLAASDNGRLPANARQILYAARPRILEQAGRFWKHSASFTQRVLPDFMAENPELTKDWDVVFDARGHFEEPHTGRRIGLGTVEVRDYVGTWRDGIDGELEGLTFGTSCPTCGPADRYRHALFVEKEGFDALLRRAAIAERYDIAVMSTKGLSVTAARRLVEDLSGRGVAILVLHDFDKSGLAILHTLRNDTRRYRFAGKPNVIDLGLRLKDVQELRLADEPVVFARSLKKDPRICLKGYGATRAERDFLAREGGPPWEGRRVELNALTSRQLIDFLERKLAEHGVGKLIPGEEALAQAYRLAYRKAAAQDAIDSVLRDIAKREVAVPASLAGKVADRLRKEPARAWDDALAQIAAEDFGKGDQARQPRPAMGRWAAAPVSRPS